MALSQSAIERDDGQSTEVASKPYLDTTYLSPFQRFMFGIKSPDAKRQYPKLLEKFLDFLTLKGTMSQKSLTFYKLAKEDPEHIENQLTKFIMLQTERVYKKEIAAGTLRNYIKSVKLFCKMNKIQIFWELLIKGLPAVRQYAEDRVPTKEEIRKLIDFPDRRIRPIILTTLSSGIRVGAWDYMKWKHIVPIYRDEVLIAGKLLVYPGEPEEYYIFMTSEAYNAVKEWMDFRASFGEEITAESWVLRDTWQKTNIRYGHRIGLAKYPKQFKSTGIKSLVGRALQIQGIREPLRKEKLQKKHEWKTLHGFRKFYKTQSEKVMKSINVEITMGHNIGISNCYYKPTENELLEDYLRAVELLTINYDNATLKRKIAKLTEQKDNNELIIKHRLKEKEDEMRDIKLQLKTMTDRVNSLFSVLSRTTDQEQIDQTAQALYDSGMIKESNSVG